MRPHAENTTHIKRGSPGMIDGCLHARRPVDSPQAHANAPDRVLLLVRVHVRVYAGAGGKSRCADLRICEGGIGCQGESRSAR